jgi:hypothetical protein
MRLRDQEALVKAQAIQIQKWEESITYLSDSFQEAAKQYNGLVQAVGDRGKAVNETLADLQLQVCWTMQHQF